MRKLLLAVSLVSAFVLIAEESSARPRGARSAKAATQPAAASAVKRPDIRAAKPQKAQKAQESAEPPRHWRVAVPLTIPRAQRRNDSDAQGSQLAASAGADDIARPSSAPQSDSPQVAALQAAAARPEPATRPETKARPASAPAASDPQRPVRTAMARPDAPRKASPVGPKLPHKFAVCYWNQTGQCIAQ
ncbi:MAG: hypothetical protein FJX62_06440 [Alphaproteobacteria bacterium]|nr:hypothetical protein [Alphaproteobacteria bacterium]